MKKIAQLILPQLIIALVCGLIMPPTIQAQSAQPNTTTLQLLKVSPVIIRPALNPGQVQTYQIEVENLLDQPMPMSAQIEGFDASDEESGFNLVNQPEHSPLADWITISPKDIIIPAKSKQIIELTINIPSQVNLGGYYAMMYLTPNLNDSTLSVKGRIGVLILASIGAMADDQSKPEVVEFNFDQWIYQKSPAKMQLRIKNPGLYFQSVKPRLTIKPLFGESKEVFLDEKVIMPGKIRRWQENVDFESIFSGIYFIKVEIQTAEQPIQLYRQLIVFPIAWFGVGLIGLCISILIWTKRRGLSKAINILIKGD